MKFILRVTFLLSVLVLCITELKAQAQQIAFVNVEAVVPKMKEYRDVQYRLETFQKQAVKKLETEKKEVAKFYRKTMEEVKAGILNPTQQRLATEQLKTMQQELQKTTLSIDKELAKKEKELSKTIYKRLDQALAELAQKEGYNYILDKAVLLDYSGGIDATMKLRKILGIL